jgi:hypothetical protein
MTRTPTKLSRQNGIAARGKTVAPVPAEAHSNAQMALFQTVLANTDEQREGLSNAIDLWDSIPRYAITRSQMNAIRTADRFLETIEIPFRYGGCEFTATIDAARVKGKNGQSTSYYPSAREELIEHALRKISVEQQAGFFDAPNRRSGARFSLHALRKELEAQGHSLKYEEIIESLDILAKSTITIQCTSGDWDAELFRTSPYFPGLSGVRRKEYDADRSARWAVEFHHLVTRSIGRLTYRQFNYQRLMKCRSQLSRWLFAQLVLKYTQASITNSFEMRYSTIKRDSALLNGYARERAAIAALDAAWDELKELGALSTVKKAEQRGSRSKLEEVIYTIHPSIQFAGEQKAANRRQNDGHRTLEAAPSAMAQGE